MKTRITTLTIITICSLMVSCSFNQSTSIDFITGITTKGNGLFVNKIYLSNDTNRLKRTKFEYGEKFYLHFDNVKGFKKENNMVFPGMEIIVLNKANDTIMYNKDLYAEKTEGYDIDPLALFSYLTVARPLHSEETYTLINNIWDKKGTGTFNTTMDFKVIPNPEIIINTSRLKAKDIYLYNITKNKIITDEVIGYNEEVSMVLTGLEGFKDIEDKTSLDLSIKITDANYQVLIEKHNLLGDKLVDSKLAKQAISAYFNLKKQTFKNPIMLHVEVLDRIGNSKMMMDTKLTLQ